MDVVDIVDLDQVNAAAFAELRALTRRVRPALEDCEDPIRAVIAGSKLPDRGKVPFVVHMVADGGRVRVTRSHSEAELPEAPDLEQCLADAYAAANVPTRSTYALDVRVHLCIQPNRPHLASRL